MQSQAKKSNRVLRYITVLSISDYSWNFSKLTSRRIFFDWKRLHKNVTTKEISAYYWTVINLVFVRCDKQLQTSQKILPLFTAKCKMPSQLMSPYPLDYPTPPPIHYQTCIKIPCQVLVTSQNFVPISLSSSIINLTWHCGERTNQLFKSISILTTLFTPVPTINISPSTPYIIVPTAIITKNRTHALLYFLTFCDLSMPFNIMKYESIVKCKNMDSVWLIYTVVSSLRSLRTLKSTDWLIPSIRDFDVLHLIPRHHRSDLKKIKPRNTNLFVSSFLHDLL